MSPAPPLSANNPKFPPRLIVVAGTYDGVLAGWDTVSHDRSSRTDGASSEDDDDERKNSSLVSRAHDGERLKMSFAMAAHGGSVKCISISSAAPLPSPVESAGSKKRRRRRRGGGGGGASGAPDETGRRLAAPSPTTPQPGTLLTGSYDESLQVYNLLKHTSSGSTRTPSNLGSPTCSDFAPPSGPAPATHALVGLSCGKIVLYKKRDWTVQHVLSGHDAEGGGGVTCVAVHPTGKMALSGGSDGKIVLWDLTKGRLAFAQKIPSDGGRGGGGRRRSTVNDVVWSDDGNRYAFCHGSHVTVRDVSTGDDLLDVSVPSRVNGVAFVGPGDEGLFLAAACDDGSLPLFCVGSIDESEEGTIRGIMAIEPVDRLIAGDERFKCIKSVKGGSGFLVVTANSGGVVSLVDLEGGAVMLLADDDEEGEDGADRKSAGGGSGGNDDEGRTPPSSDVEEDEEEDDDEEVAAEILESVRVGSGARITKIAVWSYANDTPPIDGDDDEASDDIATKEEEGAAEPEEEENDAPKKDEEEKRGIKRKGGPHGRDDIEMDAEAVERARALVAQAKKRQRRKEKKKGKKQKKSKGH